MSPIVAIAATQNYTTLFFRERLPWFQRCRRLSLLLLHRIIPRCFSEKDYLGFKDVADCRYCCYTELYHAVFQRKITLVSKMSPIAAIAATQNYTTLFFRERLPWFQRCRRLPLLLLHRIIPHCFSEKDYLGFKDVADCRYCCYTELYHTVFQRKITLVSKMSP